MTNYKTNYLNNFIKFTIIFFYLFSANVFPKEDEILKIIENNWNETQTLTGQFHQKLEPGKVISGDFYIEKPFKSNFTYNNHSQDIITSEYFINIVDKQGNLLDRYPIINQPVYMLLSQEISLRNIFIIKSVEQNESGITIKLKPKNNKESDKTSIILTFNSIDYLLKNWEIIDELGQSTYLEFTNIRKNISIDQSLFIFKEKNQLQSN